MNFGHVYVPEPNNYFPFPPENINQASSEVLSRFICQFNQWRADLMLLLEDSSRMPTGSSSGVIPFFQSLLASEWPEEFVEFAERHPHYNIFPFPDMTDFTEKHGTDKNLQIVEDILRWRGSIIDMVLDICDTIQPSFLNQKESLFILKFFNPPSYEGRCVFCLTKHEDKGHPNSQECFVIKHIRAKWPKDPFSQSSR